MKIERQIVYCNIIKDLKLKISKFSALRFFYVINNIPTESIENFDKINIVDFLAKLSIIKSKGEARRLIEQGGIEINNVKRNDINESLILNKGQELIVKKGKKTFIKVCIKGK